MNIIKRWKNNRELKRLKREADEALAEREKEQKMAEHKIKLQKIAEDVKDDVAKLGLTTIDRYACDDDYEDATTYASHPSGGVYKIKAFLKGGYSITKL